MMFALSVDEISASLIFTYVYKQGTPLAVRVSFKTNDFRFVCVCVFY